jgi:hypothetical protein
MRILVELQAVPHEHAQYVRTHLPFIGSWNNVRERLLRSINGPGKKSEAAQECGK